MTRLTTASTALILLGVFLIIDIMQVVPNPYNAPSMFSLGSGEAAAGGFCGSLPGKSTR